MMKSETENVVTDVLGQEHLHAIIEQVEKMLGRHVMESYKPS